MTSFRILGPVEVWAGERRLALGGPRQLALLAFLLLHPNRAVSSDALIDALWGPERAGASKRLQVGIARLRRALQPLDREGEPVLRTVGGGYLLAVPLDQLDAEVFGQRVRDGQAALDAGDPARATGLLSEALELWRGPPLAEVAFEDFAQAEVRRLEELRLVALEARIDADLRLGRHAQLVGELEALLAEQPMRERVACQLMLALYRAGRQADALAVYRNTSEVLRDELGLEPSPALQDLERSILRQDAALGPLPRVAPDPQKHLPVPATPFLGRARELAEVTALLSRPDTHLLTLTGAGGSGKTRLALRVAEACATDYRDGAWFVGFADIADPELIAPTIAQALGLADQPDLTPARRLAEWLRDRELLLLLDNLEQLAPGTAVLGELLATCPWVTLLTTSREPLHLAGEQQYEVPTLERENAIELFISRARAVAPQLSVDCESAGEICDRLDRLPLAIELTAARTKLLSPAEILARLESRLPVLGGGPRDAPPRQRTLRATIDWSHELLTDEEQRLFARLAVFTGGCTLAAAEAVCDANLDTLQALVDRSLLRVDHKRYWMLQLLHEYALERLVQSGEVEEVRGAHAQFLVELLEAEQLPPPGWPDAKSLESVAPEQENFTAALEWASRAGGSKLLAQLAAPLVGVWVTQGRLHDANRWMTLVLGDQETYAPRLAAQVRLAAAILARLRGDNAEVIALGRQALAYWQEVGDARAIGVTLTELAPALRNTQGDVPDERAAFEQAIQFARDNAFTDVLGGALANLADLLMSTGRLEQGRALCEEGRAVSASGSGEAWVATANLAYIEMVEGRPAEAERLSREALENALARGDLLDLTWSAILIAWPLAHRGQHGRSARLLGAGRGFLKTAGATGDWMARSCEAAVSEILYQELGAKRVDALFEEGGNRAIEDVVRDALTDIQLTDECDDTNHLSRYQHGHAVGDGSP